MKVLRLETMASTIRQIKRRFRAQESWKNDIVCFIKMIQRSSIDDFN